MTNIKNFESNLLNIDKMSHKNTDAVVYSIKWKVLIMKILTVKILSVLFLIM